MNEIMRWFCSLLPIAMPYRSVVQQKSGLSFAAAERMWRFAPRKLRRSKEHSQHGRGTKPREASSQQLHPDARPKQYITTFLLNAVCIDIVL